MLNRCRDCGKRYFTKAGAEKCCEAVRARHAETHRRLNEIEQRRLRRRREEEDRIREIEARRRARESEANDSFAMDMTNPLNPLSPLYIGRQDGAVVVETVDTPSPSDPVFAPVDVPAPVETPSWSPSYDPAPYTPPAPSYSPSIDTSNVSSPSSSSSFDSGSSF